MEEALQELKEIERKLLDLNRTMQKEEKVYAAELEDRLKKGLTGEDAIRHYNEWMDAAGMSHLKVKK